MGGRGEERCRGQAGFVPSKWNKSTLCTGLRATSEPAALGALSVAAKPCCFSFFLVHKAFLLSLFLSAPSDASGPQGMAWGCGWQWWEAGAGCTWRGWRLTVLLTMGSWSHVMAWVGRDPKADLIPTPHGRQCCQTPDGPAA